MAQLSRRLPHKREPLLKTAAPSDRELEIKHKQG